MTFHENIRYWIWLQRAVGKGANLERLLEPYGGDVQALCEEDPALRDRRLKAADEKRMRWYDVILYLTMMIEVFYREFEDKGQYFWAKEMLEKSM